MRHQDKKKATKTGQKKTLKVFKLEGYCFLRCLAELSERERTEDFT